LASALIATPRPRADMGIPEDRFAPFGQRWPTKLRRDRSEGRGWPQAITLLPTLVNRGRRSQQAGPAPDRGVAEAPGTCSPGFPRGDRQTSSRDEQRHIAFGVKMVADLVRARTPSAPRRSRSYYCVRSSRTTAAVFVPPGVGRDVTSPAFGFHARGDLRPRRGRRSRAGCEPRGSTPPERLRVRAPVRSAARGTRTPRAWRCCAPGTSASRTAPVKPRTPRFTGLLFDGPAPADGHLDRSPAARILWGVRRRRARGKLTVEKRPNRHPPAPGRIETPDLTFPAAGFQDWVDVSAGRADPVRAVLTRKNPTERQAAVAGPRARNCFG